jgi:PAS domain S-box-containing protein
MTEMSTAAGFRDEFYRDVFYMIESPTLIIDDSFTVRDVNQAAVKFLEYETREQLIGTDVNSILVNTAILNEVAEQIAHRQVWEGEAKIRTRTNRILVGEGSAVPIERESGEQVIVGVFSDMTERRRYTSSLKILNRVMRHNLRTEANIIIGHLEHLRSVIDESHHGPVEEIYGILEDLLDRAQTARELEGLMREDDPESLSAIRLDQYVEQAVSRARQEYTDTVFDCETQPIQVIGSRAVTEMLDELIENAVEHNDSATPRVEVSIEPAAEAVTVTVADNGPGVEGEKKNRIFGREEIDDLRHGDGFGLFVVDQMMKAYGGDIWVEDNEPRGARFKLQFPRSNQS